MKFFNQTLPKKFQSPPKPLLKTREPINRTLHENFQADLAQRAFNQTLHAKS